MFQNVAVSSLTSDGRYRSPSIFVIANAPPSIWVTVEGITIAPQALVHLPNAHDGPILVRPSPGRTRYPTREPASVGESDELEASTPSPVGRSSTIV